MESISTPHYEIQHMMKYTVTDLVESICWSVFPKEWLPIKANSYMDVDLISDLICSYNVLRGPSVQRY